MYGLIGKKLKHSFSAEIHHQLGNKNYQLYETDDIETFLKSNNIEGVNITIPYKTDVIPFLDDLDEIAKTTYSVNTIVKQNGLLIGYNTDYYGLESLLSYNNIDIENKNILILGNGSVSKTVIKLMRDKKAKTVIRLCRTIKSKDDRKLSEYTNFNNYEIIINTTPVGMYPHNDDKSLLDLSSFTKLEAVVDLIYNPLRTQLLIDAEKCGIKAVNGLYMLVMQAVKAHEIFFNKQIPLNLVNRIYRKIYKQHLNIVYIGLPLSGKSKYTKIMSKTLHKKGLDIDNIIEKEAKSSIPDIFVNQGEITFRNYEAKVVKDLYKLQNIIISTGGGLVENSYNMDLLKQNGLIIFLNKDPEVIAKKEIRGRPLLKSGSDIIILAKRRVPMYHNHADIVIDISKDTETHVKEMKERIDEYIGC